MTHTDATRSLTKLINRTTAVFLIKYLRTLGFDVTNDVFAENASYFRNSLVRANYNNIPKDIHEMTNYLVRFLRNLLLAESKCPVGIASK